MKIADVTIDEKMKIPERVYEALMKDTDREFGLFEIVEEVRSWVMEEQGSIFPLLAEARGNGFRANIIL